MPTPATGAKPGRRHQSGNPGPVRRPQRVPDSVGLSLILLVARIRLSVAIRCVFVALPERAEEHRARVVRTGKIGLTSVAA